jgi:hypothetical protein
MEETRESKVFFLEKRSKKLFSVQAAPAEPGMAGRKSCLFKQGLARFCVLLKRTGCVKPV